MEQLWRSSFTELREQFRDAARSHGSRLVCVLRQSLHQTTVPEYPARPQLPRFPQIKGLSKNSTSEAAFCESGVLQNADGTPKTVQAPTFYDRVGKPIANLAGQPYAFEPDVTRIHDFYGKIDTFAKYREIARGAATCLRGLPNIVKQVIWRDWDRRGLSAGENSDDALWTNAVFELSWRRIPGSPLSAGRYAWNDKASFELSALELLFERARAGRNKMSPQLEGITNPPTHLYSVLEDMLGKSVAACDIILELSSSNNLGVDPTEPPAGGSSGTPDDNGDGAESDPQTGKEMTPAAAMARATYKIAAECMEAVSPKDQAAYDWIKDNDLPEDKAVGILADYELPKFVTWRRHLRIARNALGEQKYSSRTDRAHGPSIVHDDEI